MLHTALRAAARRHAGRRRPGRRRRRARGADRMGDVHRPGAVGRVDRAHRRARSGPWSTSASAAPTSVPVMAYEALRAYADAGIDVPVRLQHRPHRPVREDPRPRPGDARCSSSARKTFTTLETLTNATEARNWLLAGLGGDEAAVAKHFVAVSTNAAAGRRLRHRHRPTCSASGTGSAGATRFDSAVGLSLMIAIGPEQFGEMLAGFHAVDEHFRTAPFERTCRRCWACSTSGTTLPRRRRRTRSCRTRSTCTASPPTCSSSPWRATASRCASTARRSTTRPARSSGASPAPTASTPSTS